MKNVWKIVSLVVATTLAAMLLSSCDIEKMFQENSMIEFEVKDGVAGVNVVEENHARLYLSKGDKKAKCQDFLLTFYGTYEIFDISAYDSWSEGLYVKVPVTVENAGESSDELYNHYYSIFTPSGQEAEETYLLFDDEIKSVGALRPGATVNTFFCFKYTEDGQYVIEMKYLNDDVEIYIDVAQ